MLGWSLAASAAALFSPRLPFAVAKEKPKGDDTPLPGKGRAKRLVLLYMAGGATQFETWAPKKKGSPNMGEAEPINTSVEGIEVGSYFPRIAKTMDDVCILRSVTTREGNHDRGRYLMHTGYVPNPTVQHPGLGSYVAQELGDPKSVLPNFVSIGGSQGAGFLGVEWDPFVIQNPAAPVENLTAPPNIDQRRRDTRLSLLDRLNREFESDRGDEAVAPHRNMFDRAKKLMDTAKNRAFDVTEEPESILKLYGESTFGKGCVVARRLLEQGVKVVEVVLGGWDTHNNEHAAVKALAEALDPGMSGLLKDLRDRGMLDETLVYCFSEFGRTPRVGDGGNGPGGRGHYPQAFSVALAGGGVRGGRVVGATDPDGVACSERPIAVQELHASICHAVGIDQDKIRFAGHRPVRVVDHFEGTKFNPLPEVFA
jgi:hypothetical protein